VKDSGAPLAMVKMPETVAPAVMANADDSQYTVVPGEGVPAVIVTVACVIGGTVVPEIPACP